MGILLVAFIVAGGLFVAMTAAHFCAQRFCSHRDAVVRTGQSISARIKRDARLDTVRMNQARTKKRP